MELESITQYPVYNTFVHPSTTIIVLSLLFLCFVVISEMLGHCQPCWPVGHYS